jgi:protein-S-isoprenylcysteine O-methyltransferase Ste14
MLAAEHAEFWAAIVGLAAAFVIAAAVESPPEDTNMTLVEAMGSLLAYIVPCVIALWALVKLSRDATPPDSDLILLGGVVLFPLQLGLLMWAKWANGRQTRRLEKARKD